jgi:hypothetical protein
MSVGELELLCRVALAGFWPMMVLFAGVGATSWPAHGPDGAAIDTPSGYFIQAS